MTTQHSIVQQLVTNVSNNAVLYPTSDARFIKLNGLTNSLTEIAEKIDGVIVNIPSLTTGIQSGGRSKSTRNSTRRRKH